MEATPTYRLSFLSFAFALLILASLGVATLWDMLDGPGSPREEAIAKTPEVSLSLEALKKLPGDARFYLSKRYALKDEFIDLDAFAKYRLLDRKWTREVSIGEDGFLFLRRGDALRQAQGRLVADEYELKVWAKQFAQTRRAFGERGVPFVFVVAPNKHSIYADRLPAWLGAVETSRSLASQIIGEAHGADLIAPDLTAHLASIRKLSEEPILYHRTDTHWTEYGAALAIDHALKPLGFALGAPEVVAQSVGRGGDLARLTGWRSDPSITAPFVKRSNTLECFSGDSSFDLRTLNPLPIDRFTCENDKAAYGEVVVFMDSFGVSAAPTIANAFRTSRFFWKYQVDLTVVDELRPDLVMQIIVERKLPILRPPLLLRGLAE